jgi:hypothetical protein
MIFTGNFPTATNQTAITLTITNSAIVTTNGMSDMEVHVQYMWGTPPTNQVDYIGEFTSSDGLSYTLANYLGLESSTAVLLNSDDGSGLATLYEPQISVYADSDDDGDIENSPGTFEPTVISVGNLSDRLTNGVIKVSVNGTQFPLKQLQDGNYYVEDPLRPGWPRFFLNSPEILAIAPSIATPGVVTEDSGNYNQAQVVYTRNGSAQVVDEQTPSFQPIQLMQQVLSQGHLSGGWSLNQLTNVAVLCFGDRVNVFLDALYQNRELNGPSQNTIQVGSFWWKKLMDPGNGNASLLTGNRTIKINNSRQDVFAGAKCLWICLHANMGWMMQYFRENVGNQDSNGYTWEEWAQESSEAVTGDAARMTAAGAQVYLQFITIVCPGAGISLDINNFSDGQWSAALGYVDKLPAGVLKNLKITSNGAVWHQFDETAFPMVSRLKTGIGKSLKVAGNSDRLGNRFFSALKGGEKVAGGVTSEGMVNGIVQGIDRHHIIPPGEGRWPEAEELRQMAASVGLTDFDEGKWNCALLPGRRKGADALYRTDPWVVKQGLTGALSHNKTLGRDYFQQCRDHLRTLISQAQQDGITAANQAYWQQKLLQGIDNIAQKFVSWQHAEWVSSINYR